MSTFKPGDRIIVDRALTPQHGLTGRVVSLRTRDGYPACTVELDMPPAGCTARQFLLPARNLKQTGGPRP